MLLRIGFICAVIDLLCHGVAVLILLGREPVLCLVYGVLFVRAGLETYSVTWLAQPRMKQNLDGGSHSEADAGWSSG